jgi:enamine deaminase RidA (YjgF/YER057c/UK114 family)
VFLVNSASSPMDFKAFMEGYTQFFGGGQPNLPARSVIGVAALANPGFLVEIEVIAAKDKN